jgi:hypothetical protein
MNDQNRQRVMYEYSRILDGDNVTIQIYRTDPIGTGDSYVGPNAMGCTRTFVNGKLQSIDDEPSVLFDDGSRQYHHEGNLHRINGPAIITENGGGCWYHYGYFYGTGNENDFHARREKLQRLVPPLVHPRVKKLRQPEDLSIL